MNAYTIEDFIDFIDHLKNEEYNYVIHHYDNYAQVILLEDTATENEFRFAHEAAEDMMIDLDEDEQEDFDFDEEMDNIVHQAFYNDYIDIKGDRRYAFQNDRNVAKFLLKSYKNNPNFRIHFNQEWAKFLREAKLEKINQLGNQFDAVLDILSDEDLAAEVSAAFAQYIDTLKADLKKHKKDQYGGRRRRSRRGANSWKRIRIEDLLASMSKNPKGLTWAAPRYECLTHADFIRNTTEPDHVELYYERPSAPLGRVAVLKTPIVHLTDGNFFIPPAEFLC